MNNFALTLFTLLAQASVGIYIINALWNFRNTTEKTIAGNESRVVLCAFLLGIAGLIASFTHLGYPLNSINALHNLENSWMSREILTIIIYLFSLSILLIIRLGLLSKKLTVLFRNLTFIAAIFVLVSMIKVYTLPGLANMNSSRILISFLITTVITGTSALVLLNIRDHVKSGNLLFLIGVVFTISFLFFLAYPVIIPSQHRLFLFGIVVYSISILMLIPALIPKFKNIFTPMAVIFIILGLIAELINRLILLSFTAFNI